MRPHPFRPRRRTVPSAARRAAVALLLLALPAAAAPPEVASIHARELRAHPGAVAPARPLPPPRPRGLLPETVVYGYLPYWVTNTSELRFDLLSHVGWFSVELTSSGTVDASHGWPDTAFVDAAHAAGTKVEVVFTLFSASGINTLVGNADNRSTAVATAIAQLEAGGADGVNLDLEGAPASARTGLTTFFCQLRQGLDDAGHPDASISIAGPAVDWSAAWDLAALLDCGVDSFFIMGYDFYGSWGSYAGPSGLLRVTPVWRPSSSHSEQRSMAEWTRQVTPAQRRHIVLGVPYYGNQWQTGSDQPGATASAYDSSVTYARARQDLAGAVAPRQWEAGSQTPWYTYVTGGVRRQVWYDDEESLRHKYEMAKEQGLGGVGMWALGYDIGHDELWDLLAAEFSAPDPVLAGSRGDPLPIATFPFHDERDTRDATQAPSNYFNFYACAPDTPEYGREVVYRLDLCQPGTVTAGVTDGTGVDVDLHLLDGLEEADCLARDDASLSLDVEPGAYYLVADTYISDAIEQAGPFALDVDFTPTGGAPCAAGETCVAGVCVAPQADGGVADAGDDAAPAADAAPADAGADAGTAPPGGGCGCVTASRRPGAAPLGVALAGLAALLAGARRRR